MSVPVGSRVAVAVAVAVTVEEAIRVAVAVAVAISVGEEIAFHEQPYISILTYLSEMVVEIRRSAPVLHDPLR